MNGIIGIIAVKATVGIGIKTIYIGIIIGLTIAILINAIIKDF